MNEGDTPNIRVRVRDDAILKRWRSLLEDRKISQTDAVIALLKFIIDEDPLTQAMVFEQIPVSDRRELSRIVLRRLARSAKTSTRSR